MPDVDLTYVAGTCSVGVGATSVVGVATLWAQPTNVRQWDLISIDGGPLVPIVASAVDDSHITISAWTGAAKAGVTYVIYQVSPLRFVGAQAMVDVETMLAGLNTDGWYRYVNPAFADPTTQGIVANEGQFALKYTTGQLWIMSGGVWVLTGIFKPFGIAAPYDNAHSYQINDVATLNGSSYIFINPTSSAGHPPPNATYWAVLASIGLTPWLPPVAWATGVAMVAGPPATLVTLNNSTYVCLVSHTSGTFATDLAAGKWRLLSASPFLALTTWLTATAYVAGPPSSYVSNGGSSYVCLVSHTSGTFATDLAAGKWGLVASKGANALTYGGSSATSLAIAVASKDFTDVPLTLAYQVSNYVRASSAANGANFMEGFLTAYSAGHFTLNVQRIGGTGTFADWVFSITGIPGTGAVNDVNGQTGSVVIFTPPQGRITLTSATPVMGSSVAGATRVYYTPAIGFQVCLWNGTNWVLTTFAEVFQDTTDTTKSPSAVAASSFYDLFAWNDGGTFRVTRGPAWTSSSARSAGTALVFQNGIPLNSIAITNGPAALRGTYVGTIASNASGTIDYNLGSAGSGGVAASLNVWNAFNSVSVAAIVTDNGIAYTYSSATIRQARASAGNQISYIVGLTSDAITMSYSVSLSSPAVAGSFNRAGIGFNAISFFVQPFFCFSGSSTQTVTAGSVGAQATSIMGRNIIYAVEQGDGTNAASFSPFQSATLSANILI